MPDFEHDPVRNLRDLADAGRAHAHGLPAEQVRALGARRHRRRTIATVAAASLAVVVFAGGALTAVGRFVTATTPPQPAGTEAPQVVPSPDPTLPRSVLLAPDQTWYHERDDFRVVSTVHGEGDGYVSVCQRDTMAALGAVDVWRRDFAFRQGSGPVIRSAALQFADERTAAAAYDRLGRWAAGCRQAVRTRGFERFSDRGRWYAPASGTSFRTGMTYGPVEGDQFGEMAYFDDQGLVLAGDRVMLVTLVVPGQDYNWAYTERDRRQTGLPMHPMFRMLPAAAANLAG